MRRAVTHRYNLGSTKFVVSIYQDEDGTYIAECPSIPGCFSQVWTEEEAESNVADAIRECLAVRAELGIPLTVTTRWRIVELPTMRDWLERTKQIQPLSTKRTAS